MSERPLLNLEHVIQYSFQQKEILQEAMTHKSFGNENSRGTIRDNERLEFLGDAVLDLVVSTFLMEMFPDQAEGELSRFKSMVVNETALAQVARSMDLGAYLLLGKGEIQTGGRHKTSLLANALEALIAAIYQDGGLDASSRFVKLYFIPLISQVADQRHSHDFKTNLQELCQERSLPLPIYRLASESGPDHQKTFHVEVLIGQDVFGSGTGKSKKEAEQQSAKGALERMQTTYLSAP